MQLERIDDATGGVVPASQETMGRDELNLAEFPLAALADHVAADRKTLVFEKRIWDKERKGMVSRRLTISASDKYGLPTAMDDEVILGLLQLSKAEDFASRTVRFSRHRLIRMLGWRDEGRSYSRLEESLKRWLGVTLFYDNAWWDRQDCKWVDAAFHILESIVIHHRPAKPQHACRRQSGDSLSSFTWNPIVFRSFQAGYLKQIDLEFYRGLKLATAKRMYRFLDKRFHFSAAIRFDLRQFACEHIGLSRGYDAAQLKRRLKPAIRELEEARFLRNLPETERFSRVCRGQWKIVLIRESYKRRRLSVSTGSSWAEELVRRGVTKGVAQRLARQYSPGTIQAKVLAFDQLVQRKDRRVSKNPPGYLVQSIRDDYQTPLDNRAGQWRRKEPFHQNSELRPTQSGPCHAGDGHGEEQKMDEYLRGLSSAGLERLEEDALATAPRILAEGYARAQRSGNRRLLEEYRRCILQRHLRANGDQRGRFARSAA